MRRVVLPASVPASEAKRFRALDVHDDLFERFEVRPPTKRGGACEVAATFLRHRVPMRRMLRFRGCVDVRFDVDVVLLADNAPINTSGVHASTGAETIRRFLRRGAKSRNVQYDPAIDPLPEKLALTPQLVLFRVALFGGVLEVAAAKFSVSVVKANGDG